MDIYLTGTHAQNPTIFRVYNFSQQARIFCRCAIYINISFAFFLFKENKYFTMSSYGTFLSRTLVNTG
jgi:hypothetical protein